jgi:hypothetical protein
MSPSTEEANPEPKDSTKTELFKKEDGSAKRYPLQIKNLGFKTALVSVAKDYQIDHEKLWSMRNDVAHRNHIPTFNETYGALIILVSFMENTPHTLLPWKIS